MSTRVDQPRQPAGSPQGGEFATKPGGSEGTPLTPTNPTPPAHMWEVGDIRHLPTGTWRMVNPNCWMKLCGRCGGTGYLPGYENIDSARCWGCMRRGYEPGVRLRTTTELDTKETTDIRQAHQRDLEREAKAEQAAKEWAAGEAEREAAEQTRLAERQTRNARTQHIDAPEGTKTTITGTIIVARDIKTPSYRGYGTDYKRLIVIETPTGARAKTFTTAAWAWEVNTGDPISVTATIKHHTEYDGMKETSITHTKPTPPTT